MSPLDYESTPDVDLEDDPVYLGVVATALAFSNNPPNGRVGPRFGAVFVVLGLLIVGWGIGQVATQPWDLQQVGVEAGGVAGDRGLVRGDRYRIAVEGRSYDCYRGQQSQPDARRRVLYDPRDPTRCRSVDSAGQLAPFELLPLTMGAATVAFGLAWIFAFYAEPREDGKRKSPPPLLRPWLMWIARLVLVASLGVAIYSMEFRCSLGTPEASTSDNEAEK